ncbi:TPA: sugar phosphate isomerase/epimerase [Candidatus Poribacteria bacterium]|nr:sugar phosphate isomerase/epimerase [Candidatus Poribacteria bacterium]
MKYSICNEMFEGWKLGDVFKFAAELGYHGVELAPFTFCESAFDLSKAERDRIRSEAEKAGVEVVGLHWLLVSPKGLHINHPRKEIRERTKEYLKELVRLCADLSGRVLVFGSPKQRDVLEPLTFDQAWRYAVETFAECAELARERGVILCIEPLHSGQTNFINLPDEAAKMVEEIDNPGFRLILDVYSMSTEELDIPDEIRKHARYLAHFHANDKNRRYPGSGEVDYKPIIAALKDVGYDGYLSVEVFEFDPSPQFIAREGIKYLKEMVEG